MMATYVELQPQCDDGLEHSIPKLTELHILVDTTSSHKGKLFPCAGVRHWTSCAGKGQDPMLSVLGRSRR